MLGAQENEVVFNAQTRKDGAFAEQDQHHHQMQHRNTGRYDDMLVAPSDEELRLMWILYATLLSVFAIFMAIVFLAIVTNKKVRRNSFNLYLIFVMVPDLLFTTLCAINCAWLAINGGYRLPGMCSFQSFYLIFGMSANAWLNGIISCEVHKMLKVSHRGHRYNKPERRVVIRNSLLAYGWAAFVALWAILPIPWLPLKTNVQNGQYCMPVEFSQESTIFFWTVYVLCLGVIPFAVCFSLTIHVLWKKLLPARGRRRELAIYFFRISAIFLLMWSPPLIALWAMGSAGEGPWFVWAVSLWGHLQGPVSTAASCLKMDIREAVFNFVLSCGGVYKHARRYTPEERTPRSRTSVSGIMNIPCQDGDGLFDNSTDMSRTAVSSSTMRRLVASSEFKRTMRSSSQISYRRERLENDQKDFDIRPNEKGSTAMEGVADNISRSYIHDIEKGNSLEKGDSLHRIQQSPLDFRVESGSISTSGRTGRQEA